MLTHPNCGCLLYDKCFIFVLSGVAITDLRGGCNEGTADVPLLEESEETVNNKIVRLMGHVNDKITKWTASQLNYLR